jgi:hypothetical protein
MLVEIYDKVPQETALNELKLVNSSNNVRTIQNYCMQDGYLEALLNSFESRHEMSGTIRLFL